MTAPAPAVQQQGVGAISADQANTYVQAVLDLAQARGFIGLSNMVMLLEGTASANDGGQGVFYWFTGAGSVDDGGVTTIVPYGAAGVGAWIRVSLAEIPPNTVTNADLADVPALTLKGNNTDAEAEVADLTVAQVSAMLAGQTQGTVAAGNDSRFTAVGQQVKAGNYTLALTDQATELFFTANATLTIPLLAWTPSAIVVLRVADGATLTISPGTGMTLNWVPSGTGGTRTLGGSGGGLANLSFASASVINIGSGGIA